MRGIKKELQEISDDKGKEYQKHEEHEKTFSELLNEYDEAVTNTLKTLVETYQIIEEVNRGISECRKISHEIHAELESAQNDNRKALVISTLSIIIGVFILTIYILLVQ